MSRVFASTGHDPTITDIDVQLTLPVRCRFRLGVLYDLTSCKYGSCASLEHSHHQMRGPQIPESW